MITGYIVSGTGSFALAFVGAGIALLIGIVSFTVLLGSLDPIPDPHSPEVETELHCRPRATPNAERSGSG